MSTRLVVDVLGLIMFSSLVYVGIRTKTRTLQRITSNKKAIITKKQYDSGLKLLGLLTVYFVCDTIIVITNSHSVILSLAIYAIGIIVYFKAIRDVSKNLK